MRQIIVALSTVTMLAGTPAFAGPCKDKATGKFITCPKGAAAAPANIEKGKDGKCRWKDTAAGHKKGQFVSCPK